MVLEKLTQRLPKNKAKSILSYLEEHDCAFKIVKVRKTKLGDFRTDGRNHGISVNDEPNKYRFLLTLIHEIAHLKTFVEFGRKAKPHGKEWKSNFTLLFNLWEMEDEFSNSHQLLEVVKKQKKSPNACSGVDFQLERALLAFDSKQQLLLQDVDLNEQFMFKEKRYKKLENRRTRALCLSLENNRKYTISLASKVDRC